MTPSSDVRRAARSASTAESTDFQLPSRVESAFRRAMRAAGRRTGFAPLDSILLAEETHRRPSFSESVGSGGVYRVTGWQGGLKTRLPRHYRSRSVFLTLMPRRRTPSLCCVEGDSYAVYVMHRYVCVCVCVRHAPRSIFTDGDRPPFGRRAMKRSRKRRTKAKQGK